MATKRKAAAPAAAAPAYAVEPGLPWIPLEARASQDAFTAFLAGKLLLDFRTHSMAPHFPAGCSVLAERVNTPAELRPGVYVLLHGGRLYGLGRLAAGGITAPPLAVRLSRLAAGGITAPPLAVRLSCDNGPDLGRVVLDFTDSALQVWRVAYYSSYPAE